MSTLVEVIEASPAMVVRLSLPMTDDQLLEFCLLNRELQVERTAEGEILIMSPTGVNTGDRELELGTQLRNWAKRDGRGVAFGSSAGFILPNKGMRAPDASWVLKSRLKGFTKQQKDKFLPLCPDFVIELRSATDRFPKVEQKMQEYMDNGAQLGWLLDPETRKAYVYRPGQPIKCLENPATLSADPELPGFVLDLQPIWEPDL